MNTRQVTERQKDKAYKAGFTVRLSRRGGGPVNPYTHPELRICWDAGVEAQVAER